MLSSADSDAGKFVHVSAFEQDPPPIFEGPQTTEASLSADFSAATSEIPVHVRQELVTNAETDATTVFQPVDVVDVKALQREEEIFESSRDKIAKTGIIKALLSLTDVDSKTG